MRCAALVMSWLYSYLESNYFQKYAANGRSGRQIINEWPVVDDFPTESSITLLCSIAVQHSWKKQVMAHESIPKIPVLPDLCREGLLQ